ncbi:ribonucleoside-diphosphate reductase subunit alpha [Cupriavidus metallidurans]|uniref:ribonucleoside-diphosphate reductase subunit alpha n=1 Tax=Cupriavidus metallidurans TaxID=119219 RepID=UPI001CCDDA71|nr:ribonucleoside-diphosphate reductase subunit alpha [Cupriavidus metallidurans]UBM12707.1 ribonucleoside-diphosphate reductase subunit alpha [Cupriavidus metallidurans]
MHVIKRDGSRELFDISKMEMLTRWACQGLDITAEEVLAATKVLVYDGMTTKEIFDTQIAAAARMISLEKQDATYVAARYMLSSLYKEVSGGPFYATVAEVIRAGIDAERLSSRMGDGRFDLERLNQAIDPSRDMLFDYMGMQAVAERYVLRDKEFKALELPQHFWMRVAMGLALNEDNPTARAIEFYDVLSSLEYVTSTPTLFNSGLRRSQLSSCFGNRAADTITADEGKHRFASLFGLMEECGLLSKFAGGIGTDWTPVREKGQFIFGTNGVSSGVVPYLRIYNDTAVAVNQGGKRKGSFAPYLEVWHPDFPDFIELRKNSGDERLRAHDIYPAAWACDLFFERVRLAQDEMSASTVMWSFFSPAKHPELHELWGEAFNQRYIELEAQGAYVSQMPVLDLWRKWITTLYETGFPWVTFKDESNRRSPQQHVGVIHNSNLCTEITLNNSDEETFVCNLGSVNVARVNPATPRFREVIRTAMRMLDNVIDLNYYPSDRAQTANMRHRPVGLGMMGYAERLVMEGIDFESTEHLAYADVLFETFSFHAIEASSDLSAERGAYETFPGSLWSQGILPVHTAREISDGLHGGEHQTLDWDALAATVVRQGMRNSNTMAIAPTATISVIAGTTPCIEPPYMRFRTEKNISAKFLHVDPIMRHGRPELVKTVFEIAPMWVIWAAAIRQKWIDQAQSTNVFVPKVIRGSDLANLYLEANRLGCKTTYYLRTDQEKKDDPAPTTGTQTDPSAAMCSILDPGCESCQ